MSARVDTGPQLHTPRRSVPIARPSVTEREIEAVTAVLRSGYLVQGEMVRQLEERFAALVGARHAVAVVNGTAALHLALLAHGIGPGDEVITSPFSFVATGNAVLYTGARPVFADICPDSFNLDPDLVEALITPRTRALLPVHLYGQPADLPALRRIADRHGLALIEDAAQAHGAAIGAEWIGATGTACFSFYATKNVMTAEGGLVTTERADLADRLRLLRSHGQRSRYHHETLGFNLRMTELQAALGVAQLERFEELTARRIANAAYLSERLPAELVPTCRPGYRHVYHQYTIRVRAGRDQAAERLRDDGIGTGVHYPVPIHQQPLYRDLGYRDVLPEAERASREVLSLPVHPGLRWEDLDAVVAGVWAALEQPTQSAAS